MSVGRLAHGGAGFLYLNYSRPDYARLFLGE
jgi:hypothetical protein